MQATLVGGIKDGEICDVYCVYEDIRFLVIPPLEKSKSYITSFIKKTKSMQIVYRPIFDQTTKEYLYHKFIREH